MTKFVFIDVDGTIIDQNDNVRPFITELMVGLHRMDCSITIWSAGGPLYAADKWNMICNRLFYELGIYLHEHVKNFAWKLDWDSTALIGKHFYIDDHESILEKAKELGHGTFQVPFYDSVIMKDDTVLLDALKEVRRFYGDK